MHFINACSGRKSRGFRHIFRSLSVIFWVSRLLGCGAVALVDWHDGKDVGQK